MVSALQNPPPDFELEFYKLHRAHEVALNNATGAYEQALLRLILVFNAASAGGFVGLVQSAGKDSTIRYAFAFALYAIYSWGLGVAFAFIATWLGYRSQRAFTMAYRARRQAEEVRRADKKDPAWYLKFGINLGKPGKDDPDPTAVCDRLVNEADRRRRRGAFLEKAAIWFGLLAIGVAVAGFALAITSVRERTQVIQGATLATQACVQVRLT
jgi:hypothetical protein